MEQRYRDDEESGTVNQDNGLLQVNEGLRKMSTDQDQAQVRARNHIRSPTGGTYDSALGSTGPSGDQTPISGYPSSTSLATDAIKSAALPTVSTALPTPRWALPNPPARVSRVWTPVKNVLVRVYTIFMSFMNAPLWAMLAAVIVASFPELQRIFFTKGTFVNASITRAITQSGNVAVPLILVVLGANLANSTQDKGKNTHADKQETKILVAALVSRMVLPFLFIAPVLALAARPRCPTA